MLFPCRIVRFSDDKAAVGSNHHVLSIDRFSIFDLLQEAFRDARCTFNSGTTFEVRIIIRRTCLDPVTFLPASVADVTLRRGSLGLAIGTVGRVGVGSRSGSSWCVEGAVLSAFIEPVLTTATISESHVPTYSGCTIGVSIPEGQQERQGEKRTREERERQINKRRKERNRGSKSDVLVVFVARRCRRFG